ncbi:hypothetical protein [Asaia sp. SF2.1]|nr:hypothetical protein [Asaia sp. SF2.1]
MMLISDIYNSSKKISAEEVQIIFDTSRIKIERASVSSSVNGKISGHVSDGYGSVSGTVKTLRSYSFVANGKTYRTQEISAYLDINEEDVLLCVHMSSPNSDGTFFVLGFKNLSNGTFYALDLASLRNGLAIEHAKNVFLCFFLIGFLSVGLSLKVLRRFEGNIPLIQQELLLISSASA